LGRKLAERALIVAQAQNKKSRPKTMKRAFSEHGRLAREWLARWREAQAKRANG
jgi:hypothetical protein